MIRKAAKYTEDRVRAGCVTATRVNKTSKRSERERAEEEKAKGDGMSDCIDF